MSEKIAIYTIEQLMGMPESDFIIQYQNVIQARENRRVLEEAPQELGRLQGRVLEARDGIQPTHGEELKLTSETVVAAWVKPTKPWENYPKGWLVKKNKDFYRSMIDDNDTEPDTENDLWEHLPIVEGGGVKAQEWLPKHPYVEEDKVEYYGETFICIKAHESNDELTPYSAEYWKKASGE